MIRHYKHYSVYVQASKHLGNLVSGMTLHSDHYPDENIILMKSQDTADKKDFYSKSILAALIYLYKNHKDFYIRIYCNHRMTIKILQHLSYYQAHSWNVSNLTSSQIFLRDVQTHSSYDFKKIPKNYTNNIPIYKRILKGSLMFPHRIKFYYTTKKYNSYMKNSYFKLKHCLKNVAPTKAYRHKKYLKGLKRASSRIKIKIEPSYKKDFINVCTKLHTTPQELIHHSIVELIKNYQNTQK